MANRWWPNASMSATRSSARVPESYPPAGFPDSPIPRWSTATTWKSWASAGISRRHAYQVSGQPCTSSKGGPSPPMNDVLDQVAGANVPAGELLGEPCGQVRRLGDGAGALRGDRRLRRGGGQRGATEAERQRTRADDA